MTLAWGLLFKLMPARASRRDLRARDDDEGLGLLLGPPLAGVAIDLARPYLSATDGYSILWPVCGIPILAAIPIVARLSRAEPEGRAPHDIVEALP